MTKNLESTTGTERPTRRADKWTGLLVLVIGSFLLLTGVAGMFEGLGIGSTLIGSVGLVMVVAGGTEYAATYRR